MGFSSLTSSHRSRICSSSMDPFAFFCYCSTAKQKVALVEWVSLRIGEWSLESCSLSWRVSSLQVRVEFVRNFCSTCILDRVEDSSVGVTYQESKGDSQDLLLVLWFWESLIPKVPVYVNPLEDVSDEHQKRHTVENGHLRFKIARTLSFIFTIPCSCIRSQRPYCTLWSTCICSPEELEGQATPSRWRESTSLLPWFCQNQRSLLVHEVPCTDYKYQE